MKVPVTVCLITYNHEKYVAQALSGILNQKTNFEFNIVVADDGSTDKTREIIQQYVANYPDKFSLIFQEKNVGAVQNWKDLLAFPKSKYIAYIEGDDYWTHAEKLQIQYDFLEGNSDFVLHCGHSIIESENQNIQGRKVHPQFSESQILTKEDFALDSPVVSSTVMFRNLGFEKLPELFNKATAGDWLFWIYLMKEYTGKCFYQNEVFGVYRIHAQSAFSSLNTIKNYKFYIENMELQQPFFAASEVQKRVKEKVNWYKIELVRELLREGKKSEARKFCWKALFCKNEYKSAIQLYRESFKKI